MPLLVGVRDRLFTPSNTQRSDEFLTNVAEKKKLPERQESVERAEKKEKCVKEVAVTMCLR